MKPNELRIGNWVYCDIDCEEAEWEKVTICVDDYALFENYDDSYKPIPLIPEWLERFGFDKYDRFHRLWVDKSNKYLFIDDKDGFFYYDHGMEPKLKYVHQLQNLYFILTGKELEVKETVKA